jgi:low affinity Fe/Cu permease
VALSPVAKTIGKEDVMSVRAASHTAARGERAKQLPLNRTLVPTGVESAETHAPQGWFTTFAYETARFSGRPASFLTALALIIVWAVTGSLFNYSDTWQLVINTATTIVTFLMVFLIQNTQNRDTLALQVKLAELIIAMRGAENRLAIAEDMCDADLEALHEEYRKRAEAARDRLSRRRAAGEPNQAKM